VGEKGKEYELNNGIKMTKKCVGPRFGRKWCDFGFKGFLSGFFPPVTCKN